MNQPDASIETTPLNTLTFLQAKDNLANEKFSPKTLFELQNPVEILKMYKWLICRLLKSTYEKYQIVYERSGSTFSSKNETQIYYAKTLAIAYIEHYVLEHFWCKLLNNNENVSDNIRRVLEKIMCLYGLWSLEKYIGTFYQWGYMNGPQDADLLRESVLQLCRDLKCEAVALVDAIAPPDFVLNSVLGVSDGEVYKHLQNALLQTPSAFERDRNWESISKRLVLTSKL